MNDKDEMLVIAEKALRNLGIAATDAWTEGRDLPSTFVKYSVDIALKQIQAIKQKVR